jgi:tetratricopeptide (TPR) repeat protein
MGLIAVIATAAILAGLAAPTRAAATGRVQGTATDENGNPVAGVKIRFVPADGSGNRPRTLKTDGKGKFSHGFLPTGAYRVELEDEGSFLESITLVEYDEAGTEVDRASGQAHPERGLPPFRVRHGHRVIMEIVTASEQYRAEFAQEVAIAEASGPIKKMRERYEAGDMHGVLDGADRLLEDNPGLGIAHYLRGLAQARLGDTEGAIDSLRRAEELAPEQQGVAGALGTVLLQQARAVRTRGLEEEATTLFAQAEGALRREVDRFGEAPDYLANWAVALEALGRTDELIEALGALIEADPSRDEARLKLLDVYTTTGRYDLALAALELLPEGGADAAMTAYNVAAGCFNDGAIPEAIAAAEKGLQFDADLAPLHRLLGRAHLSNGDNEAALQALRKFVMLAPEDPDVGVEQELIRRLEKPTSAAE